MEFVSILDNRKTPQTDVIYPVFFEDLNLNQVIEHIQELSAVPVKKYYYCLPEDYECENYRRAVYSDVKQEEVNRLLVSFVEKMQERKAALENKNAVRIDIQRFAWHILEVFAYCEGCVDLYEGLKDISLQSKGLQAFRDTLQAHVLSEVFVSMQKGAMELKEKLQSIRVKLVCENDQIYVTEENVQGTYQNFLMKALGVQNVYMNSPFAQTKDLTSLEEEIIQRITGKNSDVLKGAKQFYQNYKEYENEVILRFADEIPFYLSYYVFQKKMELLGFAFATPTVDEKKDMGALGLYDLALACASLNTGKSVVGNDVRFGNEERFLVVTGPNQGGKTTFARSLGQLVYLSKMGLDVPATAANVHNFSGILTHFSVEESVETGRGKLMDELVRLKPMMQEECQNAFVIINELFTTAANYDACIMGKKVLEHFIGQDCVGIYVTHLRELTEAHESVVSMRAMVDEQNVQNFKILRHEAGDCVCALNQVNKYHLTYEQLKERLR